jgi:hypothetical protein
VELGSMMLANYAEDSNGLLYIQGGGWDTVTAAGPVRGPSGESLPGDPVALFQGFLVIRLLFHQTETGREHGFEIRITDEDGQAIGPVIQANAQVMLAPGLPPSWMQNVNLVVGLTGMPLPRPGLYNISLLVDGQHLGDQSFRVIKGY